MLKVVLVDDENTIIESLRSKIEMFCPDTVVVGTATNIDDALKVIDSQRPDAILLDIHLNDESGFELVNELQLEFEEYEPAIIFITAYDEYAVKAFKVNAIDYLLKPVNVDELQAALEKVKKVQSKKLQEFTQPLTHTQHVVYQNERIPIYTNDGVEFLNINDILWIETYKAHTLVVKANGEKIESTRPIRFYDAMLQNSKMMRVHKSYICNCEHIKKYLPYSGGFVEMSDGSIISISSRKREMILKRISPYYQ
ncbi:MAG: LytR/AlgR family response regulator transcription factor [Thermaurantimonas sp.]|uniref:Sensory transduction protein LytT n=1 Tax=Thermaurantimonas aggregans TaxID=2173829 RepID=A0A401XJ35_9FLAO|nr:LytTR family DNA-binding domain-containing protein [Thermaurantimonas aggregans]MCX8148953.1 LytTR family DNA-binding domain-containing protein [Thermaurantimonas aggregans]GCD77032.1 sensory transduction protein LytT [Thermaurantimonas aggregans]